MVAKFYLMIDICSTLMGTDIFPKYFRILVVSHCHTSDIYCSSFQLFICEVKSPAICFLTICLV